MVMTKVDILEKEFDEREQADSCPSLNVTDLTDLPPEVARIAESEAARISAEAARIVVKAMAARKAAEAKVAMKSTEAKKLRELAAEAEEALKVAEAWFARMAAETENANPVVDEQARNAAQATGGIHEAGTADRITTEYDASKDSAGVTRENYEARIARTIKDRIVAGQKAIWELEKMEKTMKAELVALDEDKNDCLEAAGERGPETYAEDAAPVPSFNITSEEIKNIEKYLEMIERTNNDLRTPDIGAEEAIKRLREIPYIN